MTDVQKLLEQSTPLPWRAITESEYRTGRRVRSIPQGIEADDPTIGVLFRAYANASPGDAALVAYAVNRLPDYEAAVDALDGLIFLIDTWEVDRERTDEQYVAARAALDRLRGRS